MTSTLKPLIICESSAVQAGQIATGYLVEARPANGTIDSEHYSGRKVILWPDATPESRAAFKVFAQQINDICQELKLIVPNGRPHGWNIATAVAAGDTWEVLAKWAKFSMIAFEGPLPVQVFEAPDPVPASVEAVWDEVGIARTERGVITNMDNIVRLLAGWAPFKNMVWYDDFHGRYFTGQPVREWSDIDDINLTVRLQRDFGFPRLLPATVSAAVQCRAHQCHRNEPKDWLRQLKWDGKGRVDSFFCFYLGALASGYTAAVSRNFWIGMIARIYQPGCQLDNMVILEGKQGIYKSKALEAIGGKWYMEAAEEITSKDFFVALAGKLIVEVADLDSFSRADTNRIKKVISCRTDRYRQPYARASQDHPRQSIFVGTTNEQHYLKDATGARRFWPILCSRIDLDRIRTDREQLFSEAVVRYIAGEDWYRVPEEATLAEQEDRRQFDEWENLISVFIQESCQSETTMSEIAAAVGIDKGHIDTPVQKRLGAILRRLGWQPAVVRKGDFTYRRWVPAPPPSVSPAPPEQVRV